MSISVVQYVSSAAQTTATSASATISSTGTGNCLVVVVFTEDAIGTAPTVSSVQIGGVADNFSSAATTPSAGGNLRTDLWVDRNALSGQTSVTVNLTSTTSFSSWEFKVYEISGLDTASPVDKTSTNNTAGASWTSGTTATTTAASEIWIGAVFCGNTATGPSSPWTNHNSGSSTDIDGFQIVSSMGTATYSGTQSSSGAVAAAVITLKGFTNVTSTGSVALPRMALSATVLGGDTTTSGSVTLKTMVLASTDSEIFSSTGSVALKTMALAGTGLVAPTFPAQVLGSKIELLINGTWTDITQYIYNRADISITTGRNDEASTISPAQCTMTINNRDGRFTPKNSAGAYYPYITRNTQLRLSVLAASSSGDTYNGYRFWGEVSAWPVKWDPSGTDVYVEITASGLLRRLQQGQSRNLGSTLRRYYTQLTGAGAPLAYWPCEDMTGATQFASAVSGGSAMTWTGTPSLAADSSVDGSQPFAQLNASVWTGTAGSYSASGTNTYTTPGTYTFVAPGGITSLTSAECWGAGGGGGFGGDSVAGGSGAGGGEYAKETSVAVTPGNNYTVTVGTGGTGGTGTGAGGDGGTSSFAGDSVTVTAHGGKGGADNHGTVGAAGTGSTNTTHHDGGAGGLGQNSSSGGGGGGGSSAGTAAVGNAGSAGSSGNGGAGGSAPTGGGAGGDGGTVSACVDDETEVFTRDGWVNYANLTTEMEVLAIDRAGGFTVWSAVQRVNIHDGEWDMYLVECDQFSACVNAEHRFLVISGNTWTYKVLAELEPDDMLPLQYGKVRFGDCAVTKQRIAGIIWCPTVAHGNWMARRNDTIYFIGNKPA